MIILSRRAITILNLFSDIKKGQNCSFMLISSFAKFLPRLLGSWAGSGQSESFSTGQFCNHESQGDIYSLIIIFQDTAVK